MNFGVLFWAGLVSGWALGMSTMAILGYVLGW